MESVNGRSADQPIDSLNLTLTLTDTAQYTCTHTHHLFHFVVSISLESSLPVPGWSVDRFLCCCGRFCFGASKHTYLCVCVCERVWERVFADRASIHVRKKRYFTVRRNRIIVYVLRRHWKQNIPTAELIQFCTEFCSVMWSYNARTQFS